MLMHIPTILSPDLLKIMMEMGHNDELVICDGNFPKFAQPDRVVYINSAGTVDILDAVIQFLPLDDGSEEPFIQMAVEPGDTYKPPTWLYYDRILEQRSGLQIRKKMLPKKEFYPRAKCAYAVVVTGEPTFYATIILRKGTVVW